MSDIRMADGSINFDGEWLTAEDLKRKIKEKMDVGDMRFADMAAALQELNEALENSHTLEVRIVLTKVEYDRLRAMGGEDDNASVRKAIRAFVGGKKPKAEAKAPAPLKPVAEGKPAAPAKPVTEGKPAAPAKLEMEGKAAASAKPEEEGKVAAPAKPEEEGKAAAPVKPEEEGKAAAPVKPVEKPSKAEDTIPCTKCKTPIPIPTSARPLELECEFCGTSVLLPVEEKPAEMTPSDEAPTEAPMAPEGETEEKLPASRNQRNPNERIILSVDVNLSERSHHSLFEEFLACTCSVGAIQNGPAKSAGPFLLSWETILQTHPCQGYGDVPSA